MDKNKYTFAQELLRSYKLTPEQKERVLALIARERNEDIARLEEKVASLENNPPVISFPAPKEEEEAVKEGKEEIIEVGEPTIIVDEEEIGSGFIITEEMLAAAEKEEIKTIEKKNNGQSDKNEDIYYQKIDGLPKFLKSLNIGIFTKYLTHKIDSDAYSSLRDKLGGEYVYEEHLKKIKESFEELTKKYKINKQIFAKINTYINGGKSGWSEDNIQMNWSHPELLEWVKHHPNIPPAPDEDLGKESFSFKLGDEIKSFSDLIIKFKNQIHIRKENSFRNIIRKANRDYKLSIDFDNIDDRIDFYTDVEKLMQMFKKCFYWIKNSDEPQKKVKIDIKVDDNYIYIYIFHLNSIFGQSRETLRFGEKSHSLMEKANGICNVSIITNFSGGQYEELPVWQYGRKIKKTDKEDIVIDSKTNQEIIPSNTLKSTDLVIEGQQVIYKFIINRGL